MQRLLRYEGADADTLNVLEQCATEWSVRPQRFWEHANYALQAHKDPQVEVIRAYFHAAGNGA